MRRGHLFLLVTIICALCNSQKISAQEPYVVDVMAMDYAFGMKPKIKSGWVTFRMKNVGKDTHWALVYKKQDSMPLDVFKDSIMNRVVPDVQLPIGGPGIHSPGAISETTIYMEPGHYVFACFATTAEGKNHTELGMIRHIEVLKEKNGAPEPIADATVNLSKFNMQWEDFSKGGNITLKVHHQDYPMDLQIVKIAPNNTLHQIFDFFHFLADPHPLNMRGGVEQAKKGRISYLTLNLTPGDYIASSQEYGIWGLYKKFSVLDDNRISSPPDNEDKTSTLNITCEGDTLYVPQKILQGKKNILFKNERGAKHLMVIYHLNKKFPQQDLNQFIKDAYAGKDLQEPYPDYGYPIYFENNESLSVKLIPGNYFVICNSPRADGGYEIHKGSVQNFKVINTSTSYSSDK